MLFAAYKATVTITGDTADRTGIYYFSLNVAFTGGNTLTITTVDEGWVAGKSSMLQRLAILCTSSHSGW